MLSIGWCMCHLLRRNNLFCTRYEPELSLPSTEDWILQRRMLIPSTQRAIIAPPPCMGSGREMALLGNHTNPIKLLLLTINYLKHYKLFHQELRYPFSIRVPPRDSLLLVIPMSMTCLCISIYDTCTYLAFCRPHSRMRIFRNLPYSNTPLPSVECLFFFSETSLLKSESVSLSIVTPHGLLLSPLLS